MDRIMNRPVPLISLDSLPEITCFHQLNASVGHINMGAIVRHFSQWYADNAIVKRESECQFKQRKRVFTS